MSMTEEEIQNQLELEELAIQKFMMYEGNRTFIRRILQEAGMDSTGFHEVETIHCYNTGARRVGYMIVDTLKRVAPKSYLKLVAEQLQEDEHDC